MVTFERNEHNDTSSNPLFVFCIALMIFKKA